MDLRRYMYGLLVMKASIFNDVTSVLLAGPAGLPILPLAKFNFDILVLQEGPVLHSVAFSDASRCGPKKNVKIWLIGSWDLGVLLYKVLPAGPLTMEFMDC